MQSENEVMSTKDGSNHAVVLSPNRQIARAARLISGCQAHYFVDYAHFRKSGIAPCMFIVRSDDEQYAGRSLQAIRHDRDHASTLIFVEGAVADEDRPLADGPLPPDPAALTERLDEVRARASAMALKGDDRGAEALLLEYMWLRPGFLLEPIADWRHPRRYRYPILEALDRSESDPETWLKRLEQENLIERVALKDRQRECDFCGSAHLSFVDVCPNCRSIEIDQHSALHCFTCGFIAPEERFQQGEHKVCPKCGVRLRHIGSDYDRPMETSACQNCDHIFVEGDVIARCAICAHSMPPTELRLHQIFSWRLSGLGRLAAQGRRGTQAHMSTDTLNYASYSHFVSKLDWVLKIARQQRDFTFSMLGMRLDNYAALNQALGTGRTAELLDAFAERLREPLTEADLGTRPDPETLWLLLPNDNHKRLDKLHRWVQQLTNQARQKEGVGPNWRSVELTLDSKDAHAEGAESLLERLRAALGGEQAPAAAKPKPSKARAEPEQPTRIEPEVGPIPAAEPVPARLAPRVG